MGTRTSLSSLSGEHHSGRTSGGVLKGTRAPEGPRQRQFDMNTMMSVRYVTTAPFSAGVTATIMERPGDCVCTWVPEFPDVKPYPAARFRLKFPSGFCAHHYSLVRGRMR
jgi:hypothetical protein